MLEMYDADAEHWQDYRHALENFGFLPEDDWASLVRGSHRVQLGPGRILIPSDHAIVGLAYIRSGLICLRYDGCEGLVKSICEQGQFCGDLSYLLGRDDVPVRIEAIETSELIYVSGPYFKSQLDHRPAIAQALQAYAADLLQRKLKRERSLLSLSAEDRLEEFFASHSQLAGRIPQKTLAAYLGMAPETLSRLRAKRHKKAAREPVHKGSGSSVSRRPSARE